MMYATNTNRTYQILDEEMDMGRNLTFDLRPGSRKAKKQLFMGLCHFSFKRMEIFV